MRRRRKPADTKDVLSIINEVSLSVAKRINCRAPLRAVLRIYYGAGNEGDFYPKFYPDVPSCPFKRVRIPVFSPSTIATIHDSP